MTFEVALIGAITGSLITVLIIASLFLFRKYQRNSQKLEPKGRVIQMVNEHEAPSYIVGRSPYEISLLDIHIGLNQENLYYANEWQIHYVTRVLEKQVVARMIRKNVPLNAFLGCLTEIRTLVDIGNHTNTVGLVGFHSERIHLGELYLFTEFCELGNFNSYLRREINEITIPEMISWSSQIAQGMAFLASKKVVLGDLATRCCVLTRDLTVKISDFSMAKQHPEEIHEYHQTSNIPLSWRWMAIESLRRMIFSEKSDVWSFGITIWEIFSYGDHPYGCMEYSSEFITRLINGFRLEKPHHAPTEVYEKMLSCWETDPGDRPSFKTLNEYFSAINDEISRGSHRFEAIAQQNANQDYICLQIL